MIKSLTARKLLENIPQLKDELWEASVWLSGFYALIVGKHESENIITKYVKEQCRQ